MFYSVCGQVISLAVLVVSSIFNLFLPFNKNYSKPLLLLAVTAYYLTASKAPDFVLVAALLASWLGDVLLMVPGDKFFTFGGISFMLSHFLFIAVYLMRIEFSAVNYYIVVPAAIVYIATSAVVIFLVKPTTPKPMVVPMYIYLLANSSMNIFSLMQLLCNPCIGSAVAYIGAVLFFVSDCSLFIIRNYKNGYFKSYFVCMLTYILGEFLIAQGILLI